MMKAAFDLKVTWIMEVTESGANPLGMHAVRSAKCDADVAKFTLDTRVLSGDRALAVGFT